MIIPEKAAKMLAALNLDGENYSDFRMMIGKLDYYDDERLKGMIDIYEKVSVELRQLDHLLKFKEMINFNLRIFKEVAHERVVNKLEQNFELKQIHIDLLGLMDFRNVENSAAIATDYKRPLGDGDTYKIVAEYMGFDSDEYTDDELDQMKVIIMELPIALSMLIKRGIDQ